MNLDRCRAIVEEDERIISPAARVPYYPLVIRKAYGSTVEDMDGNRFIDMLSSAAALNTGHSHPRVVASIQEQVESFIHYTPAYMYHEPLVVLANKLAQITPGNYKKRVAFGLSGSDGIDGAIKLARAYTNRKKIVSFVKAYHGSTYGALSLSAISLNMRKKIGPLLPEVHHIHYPDCYRCSYQMEEATCGSYCLNELETAFKHFLPVEEIAAVFIEPIAGDAGLNVPPKAYIKRLRELCDLNGILLVSDEIQQGFGRTGKWFGIEHFDVEPDIVVLGKSIASGLPLSAIVAREEIMEAWEAPAHLFTMGGNPVSCRAALATIDILETEELVEHSKELGEYVMERFNTLKEKYSIIGDVRGKGLSIGVDLVKDHVTKEKATTAAAKICYRSWERGVILSFFGESVLRIQPPLVITKEEMDFAIDVIESSIQDYLDDKIPDEILETTKGW